jgi:hypothetical protein
MGEGEVVEREVSSLPPLEGIMRGETAQSRAQVVDGGKIRYWRPKKEGWAERRGAPGYLSVNAYTVDAGQEGFDLREWTEQKWIEYFDGLHMDGEDRDDTFERPHPGGCY